MPAPATLPPDIPIFPLPNVVLFPDVFLPLHIFEPRYRNMVRDALDGDRIIGMVLLRARRDDDARDDDAPEDGAQEGAAGAGEAPPPVYAVGCAGLITHSEQLADGRYNIALRGFRKFRVRTEAPRNAYRLASVDPLPERVDPDERARLRSGLERVEALLDRRFGDAGETPTGLRKMADAHLVNALAQYLELDPVEKQALLERDGVVARCESLIDLLEIRQAHPPGAAPPPRVQ